MGDDIVPQFKFLIFCFFNQQHSRQRFCFCFRSHLYSSLQSGASLCYPRLEHLQGPPVLSEQGFTRAGLVFLAISVTVSAVGHSCQRSLMLA